MLNQLLRPIQPPTLREMSTGQGAVVVLCGREGNRKSGVAHAMRHRLWYYGRPMEYGRPLYFCSVVSLWSP